MIRFGLIGVGRHGLRYAKHIVDDLPDARLVAVCCRTRETGERIAATFCCRYFEDYHALLAQGDIDVIIIAVPPVLHLAIIEAACRAGRHVLVEKPLAVSVVDAARISTLVVESGIRCMVAHTMRFNTVVQAVKAHLPKIGPLQSMYFSHRYEPSFVEWLDCREQSGRGVVLHLGVHSFDLVRFLSETEICKVRCDLRRILTQETEDDFTMAFHTGLSGLTGVVTGSRSTQGRTGLIEVAGERGQIIGDHAHGFAYLVQGLHRTDLPVGPLRPTVPETLKAFTTALKSGAPFPVTPQDGLRAVAIAEACYRSAETAAAVEIGA